jgi:RNA polymerase sigma-70 factor (ECF subfamily)
VPAVHAVRVLDLPVAEGLIGQRCPIETQATPTDAELLRAISAGDREASGVFVARHLSRVWRFVRALAGDQAADDAVQETFVAVLRHAGGFRGDADATAWVLTIARNATSRGARRRAGEPGRWENVDDLGLAAGWGDPERLAVRSEERDALMRAMQGLSEEDREVLWLRDVEGLDGPAASAVLGAELGAVKSRLHRARLRLMAALTSPAGGSDEAR